MARDEHPPAFQYYPRDFSADAKVEIMTTEAVGAFWLICNKAWYEDPPGTVPDDDFILSRWARLTRPAWDKVREQVLAAFVQGDDGRWHQKRMEREYKKIMRRRKDLKRAGKKGAKRRWGGHSQAISKTKGGHASAITSPMAKHSSASATATASASASKKNTPRAPKGVKAQQDRFQAFLNALPETHRTEAMRGTLADWVAHRAAKRSPLTPQAITRQANSLGALPPAEAVAVLERTMEKGWTGIWKKGEQPAQRSSSQHRSEKAAREYPESPELPPTGGGSKPGPPLPGFPDGM